MWTKTGSGIKILHLLTGPMESFTNGVQPESGGLSPDLQLGSRQLVNITILH